MMKWIAAALLSVAPAFCVGTVTQTLTKLSVPASGSGNANGDIFLLTVSWVGDASSGAVPTTTLIRSSGVIPDTNGLYIYQIITDPGSPAPTDNYDITLIASTGLDMLGGAGADRDTTTTESAVPTSLNPIFNGNVSFTLANQSVASAQGTVYLLLLQNGALRAGLGGITFPLSVPNGGTGAASFTGSRCIESNAGGTALVVAGAACPTAGVSLTGTDNQFPYQSAANTLVTSPYFVNYASATNLVNTSLGPMLLTGGVLPGGDGCAIYISKGSTFPNENRLNFDCSAATGTARTPVIKLTDQLSANAGYLTSFGVGNSLAPTITQGPTVGGFSGSFGAASVGTSVSYLNFAGLGLNNGTAATAGAQQNSPMSVTCGRGWKTNATAASQLMCFITQVRPVQGTAAPTGAWVISSATNQGASTDRFIVDSLTGQAQSAAFGTFTNCASAATPAVCGSAASGSVLIPAGIASTLTVNTTAVTANSVILLTPDYSLNTKLGVTCNTDLSTVGLWGLSGRSAGVSFTIAQLGTTITNGACFNYFIIN